MAAFRLVSTSNTATNGNDEEDDESDGDQQGNQPNECGRLFPRHGETLATGVLSHGPEGPLRRSALVASQLVNPSNTCPS